MTDHISATMTDVMWRGEEGDVVYVDLFCDEIPVYKDIKLPRYTLCRR
jgi:hypothetical protein